MYDEHNQQSAKNIKTKPVNDVDDGKQMEEAAKTMFAKNGNMAVTL